MANPEEGILNSRDGLRLRWRYHAAQGPDGLSPRAHVGLVHGYMDHQGRWASMADFLVAQGFAVSSFDFRGHGLSEGHRGHCNRFEDFVDDLDAFWSRLRDRVAGGKRFLIAHSHGGLVALRWAAQRRPEGLNGWVLVNPFTAFAFRPPLIKVALSKAMGRLWPWLPVGHELKPEELTRDPEAQRRVMADTLYTRTATPRWFTECMDAQGTTRSVGAASLLRVPTLMLLGGSDRIADPGANRELFGRMAAGDKTLREYPEMVHELLNDLGKEAPQREIASWISTHL